MALRTTGLPNQYEPNPADDRTVSEAGWGPIYLALVTAIEQAQDVEKALLTDDGYAVNRQVLRATRRALSALRTAAFVLVLSAERH